MLKIKFVGVQTLRDLQLLPLSAFINVSRSCRQIIGFSRRVLCLRPRRLKSIVKFENAGDECLHFLTHVIDSDYTVEVMILSKIIYFRTEDGVSQLICQCIVIHHLQKM